MDGLETTVATFRVVSQEVLIQQYIMVAGDKDLVGVQLGREPVQRELRSVVMRV